ncbi:uncharacterized protein LOC115162788 [Salmo trutta]|uniref:uncharacterized protein LOC115162788 n=1 Tax=Salmo trutta TaxID=8032 RepID=UPI0011317D22|nr:uncharacterized protein LOC115162788 [Salmo trutta]
MPSALDGVGGGGALSLWSVTQQFVSCVVWRTQETQVIAAPTHSTLPTAHTCFNQLCLPTYDSYEELHKMLKLAISEGSEGFRWRYSWRSFTWSSPKDPRPRSQSVVQLMQKRRNITPGCVGTSPNQTVEAGSNVHLSCLLTQCLRSLEHHHLLVEWEFTDKGWLDKELHPLIYHYQDWTVPVEARVILVRDISECDFSVLLLSVTVQRSGTYLCLLCPPPGNPDIHESHTQLREGATGVSQDISINLM